MKNLGLLVATLIQIAFVVYVYTYFDTLSDQSIWVYLSIGAWTWLCFCFAKLDQYLASPVKLSAASLIQGFFVALLLWPFVMLLVPLFALVEHNSKRRS